MEQERANALSARFHLPLTEVIRPQNFQEYIGQEHLLSTENGEISNYLRLGYLPSMVLSGSPGIGKTSLARLLAHEANYVFIELSATSSSVGEMRDLVVSVEAENLKRTRHRSPRLRVLVFIDEIHRFSTVQQDFLLPYIESGAFVFVGATTVNPHKSVRKAILSRCRLFTLEKLSDIHIERVVWRAIVFENIRRKLCHKLDSLVYSDCAISEVVKFANGDMRSAVSLIELIGTRAGSQILDNSKISGENKVDKSIVLSLTKTIGKARFGLQSESNLPLLRHLLKCLRYPAETMRSEDRTLEKAQVNGPERSDEADPKLPDNISDSENWIDERETSAFTSGDPKLMAWAEHIPYSDDEEGSPGPLYSDDENESVEVPDLKQLSASKFRILAATHACLQLLENGEAPLSILKYLLIYTCARTPPERNELINVLSVSRAVKKTGTGERTLLFNCIERLAGSAHLETTPLREILELAKSHFADKHQDRFANVVVNMEVDILYDDELVEQLLAGPKEEERSSQLDISIVAQDEINNEFTLGDGELDDFVLAA